MHNVLDSGKPANYNFIVYYDIIHVSYNYYKWMVISTEKEKINWKQHHNELPVFAAGWMVSNKVEE